MHFSKGTIQNYLEAFFDSVMFANDAASEEAAGSGVCGITQPTDQMPVVMRFLLDFLDDEAAANNVSCCEFFIFCRNSGEPRIALM